MADRPTAFHDPTLTRASAFSYACHACNRCCRNYRIRVNPFEVTALARFLGLNTTGFLAGYVDSDQSLKQTADGSCIFRSDAGCRVHPARPLVCRLYPLGRRVEFDGDERFFHLRPHPESPGEYGQAGTVGDYLAGQGAMPFIDAADRYLSLYQRLAEALGALGDEGGTAEPLDATPALLDPDRLLGDEGLDPQQTMVRHIAAVDDWLVRHFKEENRG